jgi:catechol 2,3-dioxygenase-like lactoylglutathione lyase family enzyme
MLTGIGHIAFRVKDLDRALAFYRDMLGLREAFRLEREDRPSPWIVYLQLAANSFIELFPVPADEVAINNPVASYSHFCLTVDDLPATLRAFAARGLEITGEPKLGLDGNWQYWLTDPDGNRIELMQMMPDSLQAAADAALRTARA